MCLLYLERITPDLDGRGKNTRQLNYGVCCSIILRRNSPIGKLYGSSI